MADFDIPTLRFLMLFFYPLVQLSIPLVTLLASLLAIRRTPTWIATCLVVGAGLRLLSALPAALYLVVLRDHLTPPQYGLVVAVTSIVGFVGGGAFVAGFFGLVLGKARHVPLPRNGDSPAS